MLLQNEGGAASLVLFPKDTWLYPRLSFRLSAATRLAYVAGMKRLDLRAVLTISNNG